MYIYIYLHLYIYNCVCVGNSNCVSTQYHQLPPLIKIRNASTKTSFLVEKNAIFSRDYVTIKTKQSMSQIYLFSKLLFDAGTWPLVKRSEENIIHTCIMRIYRSFYRQTFVDDDISSDVRFFLDNQLSAPAATLRMLRLSLFSNIVHKKHDHLSPVPIISWQK